MARAIITLSLVVSSIWFAHRAVDGVMSARTAQVARIERGIGHAARGL